MVTCRQSPTATHIFPHVSLFVCLFHLPPLPPPPHKVQWSHLAALKSSNSAAPSSSSSPPPPVPPPPPPPSAPAVARSQSFSEPGGVATSFAQLHLRSQDPHQLHHHHHPSPARTDPQPQPPLHHPQSRAEAAGEEVPPKVRCCSGCTPTTPLLLLSFPLLSSRQASHHATHLTTHCLSDCVHPSLITINTDQLTVAPNF